MNVEHLANKSLGKIRGKWSHFQYPALGTAESRELSLCKSLRIFANI